MINFFTIFIFILCFNNISFADGNEFNESFSRSKHILNEIYDDHRVTIYCEFSYDSYGNINLPKGFNIEKYKNRAFSVEWDHVVPAENFGRTFKEWRDGSPKCKDNKGKHFKGRKCVERVSRDYRLMQADMYNLYPEMGSINALRSNHNFEMLDISLDPINDLCQMKIDGNKVEPPINSRGVIARTYKYMESSYPNYKMSNKQRRLMELWDKMYPVDEWECKRSKRIERIQGNKNKFVRDKCISLEEYKN